LLSFFLFFAPEILLIRININELFNSYGVRSGRDVLGMSIRLLFPFK